MSLNTEKEPSSPLDKIIGFFANWLRNLAEAARNDMNGMAEAFVQKHGGMDGVEKELCAPIFKGREEAYKPMMQDIGDMAKAAVSQNVASIKLAPDTGFNSPSVVPANQPASRSR